MRRRGQLTIALLLLFCTVQAQPYYFRHYEVENGLSNNTVFTSTQDKNGFLWFGTKDGLNRFDGYRFKVFHIESSDSTSVSRDQISTLATDGDGALWAGSQKGLFRFDLEKEKLVPVIDSLPDIYDLAFDNKGRLWFTSGTMLCKFDFTSKKLTRFPADKYFNVTSICELEGKIWVATWDGRIVEIDPDTDSLSSFNLFTQSPHAESQWIEKIIGDDKGRLYAGTSSQGIKRFDTRTKTYEDLLIYNTNQTTIYVRDIKQTDSNEFWFATETGVFILDVNSGKFTNLRKKDLDPYSLSDNAIYTLTKDREGGIWVGTFFGGINYYPKLSSAFQKYYPDYNTNSISGNAVREICEDGFGNLWIGTEDAGLNKLDIQTQQFERFYPTGDQTSIAYSNIHGLLVVGNELWIGTFEHGLDILDIPSGKVKKHYIAGPGEGELKSNFIVNILQCRNGNIYLATSNSLYRYNKPTDDFTRLAEIPWNLFLSTAYEDHRGTIWVGSHGRGLFYFNPATGEKGNYQNEVGNKNSLTTNTINAIFEDSFRNLWIGTEGGGLCQLDSTRTAFTRYTTRSGMPSNFVFKILEDEQKTLWVTTSKGLINLDIGSGRTETFTKANGLLNDQFNYNSGYRDARGNLYFGSVRGLITFSPNTFNKSKFVPPVYITGLQVHGEELEIGNILSKSLLSTDQIVLPYDKSSFSIDFAALSFTSPEMTEYSYIMENFEKDWTHIKSNRKVYFTNLEPGSYTFRVKAASNGFYGKQERDLEITILPPFWATGWAYLVYIIAGSLLFFHLVRTYHNIQENKKEKEIYEAKFEFFTNIAHEIKTPLTLIKGPVENLTDTMDTVPEIRDDVTMLQRNTNRLLDLTGQILDFRQVERKGFSLDFAEVDVKSVLQETFLTFDPLAKKRRLFYNMDLPDGPVNIMADAEALNKIFSNLFSNAVKYAEKNVQIRLLKPEKSISYIYIEIRNDGYLIPEEMKEKIFEPFYRLQQTIRQKGTGIGLALARSLVELHNGSLYLESPDGNMNRFVLALPAPAQRYRTSSINQTNNELQNS